jgi:hypothetical protein
MFFNLSLRNADHVCELKRRKSRPYQQLQNTLPESSIVVEGHDGW